MKNTQLTDLKEHGLWSGSQTLMSELPREVGKNAKARALSLL